MILGKKTMERLAVIETEIKNIKNSVNDIKQIIKEHTIEMDEKFTSYREFLENNYAKKYVEKGFWAVVGIGATLFTGIIIAVIV